MYIKIKVTHFIISIVLVVSIFGSAVAWAGSPDSPGEPGATSSYSLEDLYQRLNAGIVGSSRVFTEPTTAPGVGTMHTLNEIMAKAPALDNTNGATQTQVLAGQTFWGLTASQWATQTGTMPNNGAGSTITPTTTNQSIAAGYWSSINTVLGDTDLDQWNIRSGVTIFGVTGKCYRLPATGQTIVYSSWDDGAYQYGCRPVVAPQLYSSFNRTTLPWSSSGGTGLVDLGDGTVRDTLTGLIWLKDANCFGMKIWATALSAANGLASGNCGLSDGSSAGDWRLPNFNELRSLIVPGAIDPALPTGHPFSAVQIEYWSSSTNETDADFAWPVGMFADGFEEISFKTEGYHVWPVRGGQ